MGENHLFLMQPNANLTDRAQRRRNKNGELEVQIISQKKDMSRENSTRQSATRIDETSEGIKNLVEM